MIQKQVLLILGAGASSPFGLPLGKGLLSMILGADGTTKAFQFLTTAGIAGTAINDFRTELRLAGRTSVDAFLESNQGYIEVGKAMISVLLSACEKGAKLYSPETEENWYQYLLEVMIRGISPMEMDWSKVSIVTYNYDRSLEFYLFNAIKRLIPDRSASSTMEILSRIGILHVHGMIDAAKLSPEMDGRDYGRIKDIDELQRSIKSISIIHENDRTKGSYPAVHQKLEAADSIVFLGFGFHPTNMARLDVVNHKRAGALIYGSAFGVTDSEVMFHLSREIPGSYEHKTVLGLLRDRLEIFYRT